MNRWRLFRWAGVLALAAYAYILFPYVRALWWLHGSTDAPAALVLPVEGVTVEQLVPSFGAHREHGPHEADRRGRALGPRHGPTSLLLRPPARARRGHAHGPAGAGG